MYTLYNNDCNINGNKRSFPRYDFINNRHRENLTRVTNHYRRNAYSVRSNHLLVKILQTIPSMRNLDLTAYIDKMVDYTGDLAQAFHLTSTINSGKTFFPGTFLGVDSEEIIIAVNDRFSADDIRDNWEDMSPIKFLSHPKTDMNLNLPLGKSTSDENGPSVIIINIPMLACQYRLWREREESLEKEAQQTVMQFIVSYPITNSLSSFHDVAMFNRLFKVLKNEEIIETKDTHSFFINNYHGETNKAVSDIIETYLKRDMSFEDILNGIELIHSKKLGDMIKLPQMPFTRQISWSLVVSRIPIISFLLLWEYRIDGSKNKKEHNVISRSIRRLKSDRTINQMGTSRLVSYTSDAILEDIMKYL